MDNEISPCFGQLKNNMAMRPDVPETTLNSKWLSLLFFSSCQTIADHWFELQTPIILPGAYEPFLESSLTRHSGPICIRSLQLALTNCRQQPMPVFDSGHQATHHCSFNRFISLQPANYTLASAFTSRFPDLAIIVSITFIFIAPSSNLNLAILERQRSRNPSDFHQEVIP